MITVEQAKLICSSTNLNDVECLNVIRRYIYDVKGVDVGSIVSPRQIFQLELMNIAFESACKYYLNN